MALCIPSYFHVSRATQHNQINNKKGFYSNRNDYNENNILTDNTNNINRIEIRNSNNYELKVNGKSINNNISSKKTSLIPNHLKLNDSINYKQIKKYVDGF